MTPFMRTIMAQAFADEATHMSLHDGDPGDTGDNEISGGGYAREALSWDAASAGGVDADPVSFAVPADTSIAYIGFWNGTDFLESKSVNVVFVTAGTYAPTPRYEQLAGV